MRLRTLAGAAVLAAALATAACSGTPTPSASSAPPAPPTVAASPTAPDASGAPSGGTAATPGTDASPTPGAVATLPVAQCLRGTYRLVRFVAVGDGSTYGTGQGGDVTLAFDGGRYSLTGSGREPVVVTLGGQSGDLRVDGTSSGAWKLDGEDATFTPGSTTGGGTLDNGAGGDRTKLTMKQVDGVIGLSGRGQIACTDQVMTITLAAIRLELARV